MSEEERQILAWQRWPVMRVVAWYQARTAAGSEMEGTVVEMHTGSGGRVLVLFLFFKLDKDRRGSKSKDRVFKPPLPHPT